MFDCAFKPKNGTRTIAWKAHITMMAAAQPFLSGAISKTVNMPEHSTVEDIEEAYLEGWRLGLKALAIYRDGSKQSQPLATTKEGDRKKGQELVVDYESARKIVRRRLPATRQSLTHKFSVGGHEGYMTVGLFEDGSPGELFITMAKEGSTIGGLMDVIGTQTSMALQYGVPLEVLVNKFAHMRFEPSGWTSNPDIPNAKSVVDYIFRWLGIQFLPGYREANTPEPQPGRGGSSRHARSREEARRRFRRTPTQRFRERHQRPCERQHLQRHCPPQPRLNRPPVPRPQPRSPTVPRCGASSLPASNPTPPPATTAERSPSATATAISATTAATAWAAVRTELVLE